MTYKSLRLELGVGCLLGSFSKTHSLEAVNLPPLAMKNRQVAGSIVYSMIVPI